MAHPMSGHSPSSPGSCLDSANPKVGYFPLLLFMALYSLVRAFFETAREWAPNFV
jgi:hypothetical protein